MHEACKLREVSLRKSRRRCRPFDQEKTLCKNTVKQKNGFFKEKNLKT